jgi:hypothetical protein
LLRLRNLGRLGTPGRRADADIRFDQQIIAAADQHEMLDIVATDQDEAAMAVDGGRIHDRKSRLAIAPARDIGARRHAAHRTHDEENDDERDKRSQRPENRGDILRPGNALQPLQHELTPMYAETLDCTVFCPQVANNTHVSMVIPMFLHRHLFRAIQI